MKIEKTVVQAKSRTLKATWTVELETDLTSEISEDIDKLLQEEIDREILREVERSTLKSQGWTEVIQHTKAKISDDWCRQFIKNEYRIYGNCWYFKDERDATYFSLRWSSAK